jgi:hypothetical protein
LCLFEFHSNFELEIGAWAQLRITLSHSPCARISSQVADRLCEVYGSKSKMRVDFICECFAGDVRVMRLSNGTLTTSGINKVKSHFESMYHQLRPRFECTCLWPSVLSPDDYKNY